MTDKPIVWMHSEIKSPPFSKNARIEAGTLLRRLQRGEKLSMPESRPMPGIGGNCHELRVGDDKVVWRILYHSAREAVVILEVFAKKTRATPRHVMETARRRLGLYREIVEKGK